MRWIAVAGLALLLGIVIALATDPPLEYVGWVLALAGLAFGAMRLVTGYRKPVQTEREFRGGRRM